MKLEFDEWILNRFSKYRELKDSSAALLDVACTLKTENARLEKQTESDKALIESLDRYIEALEGRDKERVSLIAELDGYIRKYLKTIKELRGHLSGVLPREE